MSRSKNICFFNTTEFWGGGEKWHFEAAEMLAQTEHNCFFVVDGDGELAKKIDGLDILSFYIRANNISFLNPLKIKRLVRFFKEKKIETVIFNSPKDLKLGGKAAKMAGVGKIVYRRGIAVEVKKSWMNKDLFKNVVTHFIFNSKATRSLLEKNYLGIVNRKETAIIYNAIDFSDSADRPNPKSNFPIVIGNAGRLVEQKGQRNLIEIAKQLKGFDVKFKIEVAGEGPLFEELKLQIEKHGLEKDIELLGFVRDMKGFMKRCDIFVSTALWEGFGFVLAEAMAARKPVIAFDLSSNPELVEDGKNGYLVPQKNIRIFTEKLVGLINDGVLRKKMGDEAYAFAKANFEKGAQFRKLLEFIN